MTATRFLLVYFLLSTYALICSFAVAAPEEKKMGAQKGYPVCQSVVSRIECRVGSFSTPKGALVERSERVSPLKNTKYPVDIFYEKNGIKVSIEKYFSEQKATGLLVLKDGEIVFEGYQYDRQPNMQMRSFSMSKTVIALLIGIANEKGLIESLDDPAAKYYRAIAGTAYGDTTIRNLLRMSSGIRFQEDYSLDKKSDLPLMYEKLNDQTKGVTGPVELFSFYKVREAEQGHRFKYASIENAVLARVLTYAAKRSITDMTREWLWNPIGAEADAYWLISSADGVENGGGGLFATLRDWGRLGLLLANDGRVGKQQIIPREFLMQATDYHLVDEAFKPRRATSYFGYGYQTWIFPMKVRTFALLGIYGQSIFVQPSSGIVMVETAVYDRPEGGGMWDNKLRMWRGTLANLGGSGITW